MKKPHKVYYVIESHCDEPIVIWDEKTEKGDWFMTPQKSLAKATELAGSNPNVDYAICSVETIVRCNVTEPIVKSVP